MGRPQGDQQLEPGSESTASAAAESRTPSAPSMHQSTVLIPAGIGSRLAAGLVDVMVVAATFIPVDQPFPPILPIAVFVIYHWLSTWLVGRSLGKALLGLRVRRIDGPVSWWWSLARAGPGYLILAIGGLGWLTAIRERHQRPLYDILLGGMVVQDFDAESRPNGLLDRLLDYSEELERTAKERKRVLSSLAGLWAWLNKPGEWARQVLNSLRSEPASASSGYSMLSVGSGYVAATVAAVTTTVAVATVTFVPPAGAAGQWLMTDRYWVVSEQGEPTSTTQSTPDIERVSDHPLLIAADRCRPNDVIAELDAGVNPNLVRDDGWTPLLFASQHDCVEVVDRLLVAGADPTLPDDRGVTPLYRAAYEGHEEVARLLVDAGANLDAPRDSDFSPLFAAVQERHPVVTEMLLTAGADPDQSGLRNEVVALHLAAQRDHVEILQMLLDSGADPNARNRNDETPLHHAAQRDHVEILQMLLDSGADPNARNHNDETPLHHAAEHDRLDATTELLRAGADPNAEARRGTTPLHIAASRDYPDIAEALLNAGADSDAENDRGQTPLDLAGTSVAPLLEQ
jgi:ankyrin repeat protein/uncharacterized RDD family membrane protein YckC